MATRVELTKDGIFKKSYVGFSWTVLFFYFFVPLIRGDFKWFFIMLGIEILFGFISAGISVPIVHLILAIIYNKIYTQNLLEKGYVPVNERSYQILRSRNLVI